MNKKPGAAAPAGESRVFVLSRPIEDKGQPLAELKLSEPELRHMIVAERKPSGAELAVSLIAQLSGASEAAIRRLKLKDLRAIEAWIRDLRLTSSCAFEEDAAGGALFVLSSPIETNGTPIERLRLREPDIEASIAVEKFSKPHEQTAAMIAALTDLTIPVVTRLKLRDLAVIEAWLTPFVDDTGSKAGAGAI